MLQLRAAKRLGGFGLEVELQAPEGTTTVVVGESGAGKTTLLKLLLGLLDPDSGRITLGNETWFDSAAGASLPSHRRKVGYVGQDYALFPHLSVLENVAFGLRAAGVGRREARNRAAGLLERLGIADLARRKPAQLSGGQQQRAALARALVLDPPLLLLDEPLSALDLKTQRVTRGELRRTLTGLSCVTLYVTHAPMEALLFGDQIVVLEAGTVSQQGRPEDLLRHPRSGYVAEFMGVNLFRGVAARGEPGAATLVHTGEGDLAVLEGADPTALFMAINPREIILSVMPPQGSARNVFRGPVLELAPEPPFGERVRIALGTRPPLVAEVTREAVAGLGLREGVEVYASFKATGVTTYA